MDATLSDSIIEAVPAPIAEALASFKLRVRSEFGARIRRLALFGSVARGEARWDSDVDVLVLLDQMSRGDHDRIIDLGTDELNDRGVLISPTVMSEASFQELERRERRLPRDVAAEGIAL